MEYFEFSKDAIIWFKSCLSNRKFKLHLNKTFSELFRKLLCGVPQGLFLGPFLSPIYLLYIYDTPQAVKCDKLL